MEKTQNKNNSLEKVTIELPKAIVDFYKFYATAKGLDPEMIGPLISFDVVDNVKTEVENNGPEYWEDFFNLKPAFESNELRQNLAEKLEK